MIRDYDCACGATYQAHRIGGGRCPACVLERRRAKDRDSKRGNPVSIQRSRDYYRANRERILAEDRALYAANREARVARARQWQIDNPDRHAANERARRAKIDGLFVEYVHPLAVLELHDGVCGICGEDVDPADFQVDHIEPVSLGGEHSYSNTQPAHPVCNMRKGNRAA